MEELEEESEEEEGEGGTRCGVGRVLSLGTGSEFTK